MIIAATTNTVANLLTTVGGDVKHAIDWPAITTAYHTHPTTFLIGVIVSVIAIRIVEHAIIGAFRRHVRRRDTWSSAR